MTDLHEMVNELAKLRTDMHNGDFLLTWDRSVDELRAVLQTAEILESAYRQNVSTRVFDGRLAVSIFRDQSTRTRFSYASAASMLGLSLQELDEKKSQIAHGETVRETANMISFATEVIGIRDDMFLGEGNKYMREVSAALDDGHREGVLPQRPAVVNLQCDLDHPTQSLADLLHLKKHFGSLEALRGKKIAMTWAYSPSYGKPLSVPQGIIGLMTRFGAELTLAHPEGYGLVPEIVDKAGSFANESGGKFAIANSMAEAFDGADVVYPKSWAPFGVMQERTKLLIAKDDAGLKELEKRCLAQNAEHMADWECDAAKMSRTNGGNALYMHCLPADISGVSCKRGEVSADVFEKYRLATYREAFHKPFVIAAMMMLTRFEDVSKTLDGVLRRGERAVFGS
ncbi:MAG: knotted carbamoyltransferase YgeW [Phycisphaerales bacterium]|nr:knotted carbamoyltransferase YgeW [Phycisphaerales bacterium]MCB9858041.1 knotted carbamoyltransferase YgeW [Phycisphaerales bacterium]MCB9864138.1 knotted carbamoyltransferase YgeW [Phycisphaerales bacterium]